MEAASLTSALKQVYYIHKNIVSELSAKIDVLSLENKQLKCSRSEQCSKCAHLQDKNQKLQEHFISLIKEKESTIKLLRAQIVNVKPYCVDAVESLYSEKSLLSTADQTDCENREKSLNPNSDDSKNTAVLKVQESLAKSKLRLIRESKRRNRYQEDIPEKKKQKSVLVTSDLAEECYESTSERNSRVLVQETEKLNGQTQGEISFLKSGDEDSSQKLLSVPEAINLSDFSLNDLDISTHMDTCKYGSKTKTEVNKKTSPGINFSECEISFGSDLKKQKSKILKNKMEEEKCKNNVQNMDNTSRPINKTELNLSISSTTPAENSELFIKPNLSHVKCSNKSSFNKNLHQLTLNQVFAENTSKEIETKKAAPFLAKVEIRMEEKSIPTHPDKANRIRADSTIPTDSLQVVNRNKLESNLDKMNEKKMDVHIFGTLDMNGSLNPDVHLSEYLGTQSCEQTEIEKNIRGVLDETVAPERVSQLYNTDSNENASRQGLSSRNHNKLTGPSEKLDMEKDKMQQVPGILDETVAPCVEPHLQNRNASLNSSGQKSALRNKSMPTHLDICTSSQSGTETSKTEVTSQTETKPDKKDDPMHNSQFKSDFTLVHSESVYCGSDEDVCDDEEDETIAPSPQQTLQGNSQLHYSIPSSFKFMPKNKLLYSAPNKMTDNCTTSTGCDNSKEEEDQKKEKYIDLGEALEEIDMNTELDQPDSCMEAEISQKIIDPIIEGQSFMDSFDRVPKTVVPEFPHIQVVRKKSDRDKLEGFSCQECLLYYKNSGLSDEAMKLKMNECSRHRAKYLPPSTPEHFWSLGFPDTAEIMDRNQAQKSCDTPLKIDRNPRRRRRLEKRF